MSSELREQIPRYLEETKGFSAGEILQFAHREFGSEVKFATSLGEEDQVLTDLIAQLVPQLSVFTLDTGRLFQETYQLLEQTQRRYPIQIQVYYPETSSLETMVREKGINLFYESVENRRQCCTVRKVNPLKRALSGAKAWITGLRRSQGVTRTDRQTFEWDEANQMVKINPLCDWSMEQLQDYIWEHKIDVNSLHAQGFISIGCAPCTRAIKEGEDIRAGRWWWEDPEHKECGLHYLKDKMYPQKASEKTNT